MGEPGFPSRGRLLLLALAVALAVSFTGIFQRDLWHPDEPRLAEMGRAMAATPGWSAAPMLAGEPFLEQPPLCVWSVAASYEVLGVSPGAARVPMALFGLLLLGVAFLLGERAGGPLAGFLSAAVLATTVRFVSKMHVVIPDVPLTLFVAAGHLAFLAARDQWREGRRPTAFALVGLAAGLAFLSKGPIGPILIAGPALLATAVTDRPFLLRAALWTAAACGAGVALFGVPWVLALARESGREAVRESLLGNSLGRFEGKQVYGHAAPFWYYLPVFPLSLLPWVLAVPALLRSGAASPEREGGRARFLGLLALAGVLLLSIPSSKRAVYVLPLLPAACVPIAAWLADLARRAPTLLARRTLAAILGQPAAAALLGPPPPPPPPRGRRRRGRRRHCPGTWNSSAPSPPSAGDSPRRGSPRRVSFSGGARCGPCVRRVRRRSSPGPSPSPPRSPSSRGWWSRWRTPSTACAMGPSAPPPSSPGTAPSPPWASRRRPAPSSPSTRAGPSGCWIPTRWPPTPCPSSWWTSGRGGTRGW